MIRRVAVLGAGTMGSRIAAHFANAGVPALLLDIVLPGEADRNAAARKGLDTAAVQRPVAFFTDTARSLVSIGNFEDDLSRVATCDWIIEAVKEDLEIKREIWRKVEPLVKPDTVLSTNTSGLSLARLADGFTAGFRERFLGTHFFNPPRYLHLVELIPGPSTDDDVIAAVSDFCDRRLGKGIVRCKDTPNFIGNRIGYFFGATVHKIMVEEGYTVEEVDALTGPLIGLPKSASFRLLDIIGTDVWDSVGRNLYEAAYDDPWRERFPPRDFLRQMIERGWLGEKSGQGFYRRSGFGESRVIEAIDWRTLEYREASTASFETVETARNIEDLGARLCYLINAGGRAGDFLWKLLSDLLIYSAERIPEISDRIVELDRAMRWGYAFQLGPFEMWDALAFEETAHRMQREGRILPDSVTSMLAGGAKAFYRPADADGKPHTEYFDLRGQTYQEIAPRPGVISLAEIKRARGVVRENAEASLIDLGDGVLCVEFHSKMNTLGEDALRTLQAALEEAGRNFEAVVIANQGEQFSAGANIHMLLLAAQSGDWDKIELFIRTFQDLNMAIRCSAKPVVAAPFGHTLGGGCEVVLHSARAQASAELYMGLVEPNVGLIPAAGGTKQMLLNLGDAEKAYNLIARSQVSASAPDARRLGYLREGDGITMNPERLVEDAKTLALSLSRNYVPAAASEDIVVGGDCVYAKLKIGAWLTREAGRISDHDLVIAEKLAYVLSGGRLTAGQTVSEQYLLDLERQAFLSLCGHPKTQARIEHMLKTGRPLRN